MRDLDYLKLLGREFPNAKKASAEIINLRAICGLPKGTEYFFRSARRVQKFYSFTKEFFWYYQGQN